MSRLSLVKLKIERANHHIRDLEQQIIAFRRDHPCRVIPKIDSATGKKIHKILVPPILQYEYSCLIGDIVHNLRSALDHLAWQLAWANGKDPSRRTCFPIAESAAKYKAESPTKVEGICEGAIRLIDALNPYKGGNDSLWWLNDMDVVDKHRLLTTTGLKIRYVVGWTSPMTEDGTPVAPDMDDKDQPFVEIAFFKPEIVKGKPVLPLLHQLSNLVDAIANQFAPFL